MQNYSKMIGALAAASALVAGNANAEVEYQLHTGYSSEYVFRGVYSGTDLVEAGIDAATEWNGLKLSAGLWHGTVNEQKSLAPSWKELDVYGAVSKDLGFATASVGYIAYTYPGISFLNSQEVSLGLSRDLGFAQASLTYFGSVENDEFGNNDGYSELALSRGFEISACLNLNVASNIGYLVEQGQATAWTTKVSLDYGFAEHAKLSPFVAYSVALSDDVDTRYNGSENEFVAGSMLSVSF
jgi:uncharacterized protein (TIGR02001 family)